MITFASDGITLAIFKDMQYGTSEEVTLWDDGFRKDNP